MDHQRFEQRAPSNQTMVDIFRDSWATDLRNVCGVEGTGGNNLFDDARIGMAASTLGVNGRFDGYKVLELGPLEGAHSYQLERLGAREVRAVESNTEAFLKCLLVKEMLRLNTRYYCGDVTSYLRECNEEFDLIFCCGILYHMEDPVELIKQVCLHTNRSFVWTHYYDPSNDPVGDVRVPRGFAKNGFTTTYFACDYPSMADKLFLGGNRPRNSWMARDEIIRAFSHFGLTQASVLNEQNAPPTRANFSCSFSRPG